MGKRRCLSSGNAVDQAEVTVTRAASSALRRRRRGPCAAASRARATISVNRGALGAAEQADEHGLLGALAALARSGRGGGLWGAAGEVLHSAAVVGFLAPSARHEAAVGLDAEGVESGPRDPHRMTRPSSRLRRSLLSAGSAVAVLSTICSSARPRASSPATTLVTAPPRSEPGSGSRLPSARCAAAVSRIAGVAEKRIDGHQREACRRRARRAYPTPARRLMTGP